MTIFQIPVANAMAWLLALAFAGAGVFNAIGGGAVQAQFQRWGYPAWWNFVTGGLEMLAAALIAVAPTRILGIALAAMLIAAAIATVIRRREYEHLPPAVVLATLTGAAWVLAASH